VSYYDDASLVLIPSGVKAAKVYSQKPTNGTGDLTFSRASTATRTNASGAIETVASNVPRLDYSGGATCPSLLLEPQRTNRLLQSNNFNTTWAFSGTGTVTQGATDPFGGTTAWTLNKTAANTFIFQSTTAFSGSTTFSIYAKAGTVNQLYLLHTQTVAFNAFFDLIGGTVVSSSNCVAAIVPVGGGWFRCSISATVAGATNIRIYPAMGGSVAGTTGNILIYAAQGEDGAYQTTYIPTTTAAVTRIADAARTAVGATSLFASQWTAFGEVVIPARGTTGTAVGYGLRSVYGSTSLANWPFYIVHGGAISTLDFQWVVSGSVAKTANVAITYGTRLKFAATSDGTLYINGTLSSASSSLTPATPVEFGLGRLGQADFSAGESAAHNQAALFKTRLTNAQLAELTTL